MQISSYGEYSYSLSSGIQSIFLSVRPWDDRKINTYVDGGKEVIEIKKVEEGTELAEELLSFVEKCSWEDCKEHIADMIRNWVFTDWETMFAAIVDGRVVGMASIMKTDYYPLPEIYPWISCVFVQEEMRGQRISEQLIHYANNYAGNLGFDKTYIPSEYEGLYEKYGYRYVKDIVNYGNGIDHLFVKCI